MNRPQLAEDPKVLDLEARNSILKSLTDAKNVAKEVDVRLATLPPWLYQDNSPLGEDRLKLQNAARDRQMAAPIVSQLEVRLAVNGPIWPDLTSLESQALTTWMGAVATQGDILDKYMPTEGQKELRTFVLLGVSLGAFLLPLILTDDAEPRRKPVKRFEPPDWMKDPRLTPGIPGAASPSRIQIPFRAPAAQNAPAMPTYQPGVPMRASDFSRIPVPVGTPFQGSGPIPAAAAPGPATIEQVAPGVFRPTGASPGAASPSMRPLGPGPHTPTYPRYNR